MKSPQQNVKRVKEKHEEIADFLVSRGYEGPVPIYTALLLESLSGPSQ